MAFFAQPSDDVAVEKGVRRDVESVGVIEAAAPDAGSGQNEDLVQKAEPPGPVQAKAGHPDKLAQIPVAAGERVGASMAAGLDDSDRVTLLSQAHGRHASAEA